MIPDIPWYITVVTIAVDTTIAVAVWAILSRSAARAGLPPAHRTTLRVGAGLFLAAWLGSVLLFAPASGPLAGRDPFTITPLVPFSFALPVAVVALALWRSAAFRRTLAAATVPALIGVQAYRVIGAQFVILYAMGRLPGHFAIPAGWGDVAVGVTAPLVALALARQAKGARTVALSWIAFGLVDLVVAVGMGTGRLAPLLAPELGRVPPVAALGAFPLVLVPAFAVPVSVLLHLAALVKLIAQGRRAQRAAPQSFQPGRLRQ